jgi:hypothetical protein
VMRERALRRRSWVGNRYGIGKIQRWLLEGNEIRKADVKMER